MEKWEDFEEVTVWSWIGLAFLVVATVVMASLDVWMFTW